MLFRSVENNSLPLGKLSGRHAFVTKLQELGYRLSEEEIKPAFQRFKALADKKKQITDQDLLALLADEVRSEADSAHLTGLQVQYVSCGRQGAIVSVAQGETTRGASAVGSGSIQAIYNAIDDIFQQQPTLVSYEINALSGGEDAQAEVHISIECPETKRRINGIGVDFDVLEASAKAYVQASSFLKKEAAQSDD